MIIEEDFERYTNSMALQAVWTQGKGALETRSPGGGQAARHQGGEANRRGGFAVSPSLTQSVVLTADLFDFGTNADKRLTVSLHHRRGPFVEFGVVEGGGIYAARTAGSTSTIENWKPFGNLKSPVRGWHRFQAILSASNTVAALDLDANGKVDCMVTLPGPPPAEPLTEVRFGGLPGRVLTGGPVLVDNIKLELVTATPVVLAETSTGVPDTNLRSTSNDPTPLSGSTPATVAATNGTPTAVVVWWILGALVLILGLLAWLVVALRRSGLVTSKALVPATSGPTPLIQQAALAELTEFAKQSLVQGLYEQRSALLETQKKAQQALIELEERLAALHLPQQERIRAYERRIAELEKELETRGEEVRELTQATLLLVRRKLEEEKGLGIRRDQFN